MTFTSKLTLFFEASNNKSAIIKLQKFILQGRYTTCTDLYVKNTSKAFIEWSDFTFSSTYPNVRTILCIKA